MAVTLSRPQLMKWNTTVITDHNRSPLSHDIQRIEQKQRMVDGTMRKFVIANKSNFSCSWEMLPTTNSYTADGMLGAKGIEDFYTTTPGLFVLYLHMGHGGMVYSYNVMFSDFSKEIVKRGVTDFWNISVTMEEV